MKAPFAHMVKRRFAQRPNYLCKLRDGVYFAVMGPELAIRCDF
jgi:hypothetical protein